MVALGVAVRFPNVDQSAIGNRQRLDDRSAPKEHRIDIRADYLAGYAASQQNTFCI
jgi:hypothetical protein